MCIGNLINNNFISGGLDFGSNGAGSFCSSSNIALNATLYCLATLRCIYCYWTLIIVIYTSFVFYLQTKTRTFLFFTLLIFSFVHYQFRFFFFNPLMKWLLTPYLPFWHWNEFLLPKETLYLNIFLFAMNIQGKTDDHQEFPEKKNR